MSTKTNTPAAKFANVPHGATIYAVGLNTRCIHVVTTTTFLGVEDDGRVLTGDRKFRLILPAELLSLTRAECKAEVARLNAALNARIASR